jgi:hypothetical protein
MLESRDKDCGLARAALIIRSPDGGARAPCLYSGCRATSRNCRSRFVFFDPFFDSPSGVSSMRRSLYLATLVLLQIAMIGWVSPPLAQALRFETAPGLAPGGWPAMLQLVATAATIVGTSVALAFPALALTRHRRSGPLRYLGLPGWATVVASCGIAAMCAAFVALELVPLLPVDARMTAVLIARPIAAGGLALAAGGVLCAELLRRSVAPARESAGSRSRRIEVVHPPELRTRGA